MTFVSYNTYFIPLVGITAGYFFLDEPVNDLMKVSVALILFGIFISERKAKKKAKKNAS
jgi:drug/metabolite transporter (DMT)-like permease